MMLRFYITDWRNEVYSEIRALPFRCPSCKWGVLPANLKCIVCSNCFEAGTVEHFSSKEATCNFQVTSV